MLVDLSIVDLFFHSVVGDETIDVALFGLPIPVHPAHGLAVVARVPGGVEHYNAVGTNQVDTQTAGSEDMKIWLVDCMFL